MECFITECGNYRIESMSAATLPGALSIIRDSFCQDEPVCIGTEVNKNLIAAEELLELCVDAVLDGASLVAVEIDSGEVVSVAFNKLQVSNSSEKPFFEIFAEERCTQPSSRELVQFMAKVDDRCNLFNIYDVDCSMEIMFMGTHRKHRKRNLATLICKLSIDIAKKLKDGPVAHMTIDDLGPNYSKMQPRAVPTKYPKICQALFTTLATQKIGCKLGFTAHLRVPLEEFVYNGISYTDRIGYEPFCDVVAMSLY